MNCTVTSNPMMPTLLEVSGLRVTDELVEAIRQLSWVGEVRQVSDLLSVTCVHEQIDHQVVITSIEMLSEEPLEKIDFVLPKYTFDVNPMAPYLFELLLWWRGSDKLLSVLTNHPWVGEVRAVNPSRIHCTLVNEFVPTHIVTAWISALVERERTAVFCQKEVDYKIEAAELPSFEVSQNPMYLLSFEISTAFEVDGSALEVFFPEDFNPVNPYRFLGTANQVESETDLEKLKGEIEAELLRQLRAKFGEEAENQPLPKEESGAHQSEEPILDFFGEVLGLVTEGAATSLQTGLQQVAEALVQTAGDTAITTVEATGQTVTGDEELDP